MYRHARNHMAKQIVLQVCNALTSSVSMTRLTTKSNGRGDMVEVMEHLSMSNNDNIRRRSSTLVLIKILITFLIV